jgi:hypothetical protein
VEVKNPLIANVSDFGYKIIIPQEEPTPVWKQIIESCGGEEEFMESAGLKPKKETLEEAAKEFVLSHDFSLLTNPNHLANRCFQLGAKWQQERMYSEEDMKLSFETGRNFQLTGEDNFNELIEQFKKK